MSSSSKSSASGPDAPVASFEYRQMAFATGGSPETEPDEPVEAEIRMTERALAELRAADRAAGAADAEGRLRSDYEHRSELQTKRTSEAIAKFEQAQRDYFVRVESEVVQLALAIARKILHREAQVDPMLIAALVHLALAQLKEGSSASIRVRPEQAAMWRKHLETQSFDLTLRVVEDVELERGDCVLDADLGTVNFSLDTQLKEVERGFFDVLAQRPQV